MWKRIVSTRHAAALFSVAAVAITGSAASVAGPACMGNPQQPLARNYYPYGPMMPQAAYRPGPPQGYGTPVAPYRGMMAPPSQRPLRAQRGNPRAVARAVATAPVESSAQIDSSLPAAGSGSEAVDENITVRINGMRFEPSNITVKPGTTVTWVHASSMPHTITGELDALRSSTLYGGQQYSHTFDAPGRYDYACDFHPSMKGSVIVEATGRDT